MKHTSFFKPGIICVALIIMFSCSTHKPVTSKTDDCFKHQPLSYTPVAIKLVPNADYLLKNDPQGERDKVLSYMREKLDQLNPGKYKLISNKSAEKGHINFYFNFTKNNENYGAYLQIFVNDDNPTELNWTYENKYASAELVIDEVASRFDGHVRNGWCKNCPSPCNL